MIMLKYHQNWPTQLPRYALGIGWLVFAVSKIISPAPIEMPFAMTMAPVAARCIGIAESLLGISFFVWRKSDTIVLLSAAAITLAMIGTVMAPQTPTCHCLGADIPLSTSAKAGVLSALLLLHAPPLFASSSRLGRSKLGLSK